MVDIAGAKFFMGSHEKYWEHPYTRSMEVSE